MTNDFHAQKASTAMVSVVSNSILVVFKLIIGFMMGSVSVISEGIHSSVDLLAAVIALFAVKKSAEPEDDDHPFGHGKFENISGTVEALLIFLAAIWIIVEAVEKLLHPKPMESPGLGVGIMLVSCVMNFFVSHRLFKVGKATDSPALIADAWHLRTDIYTSAGVMFGLLAIWAGHYLAPRTDLYWIDPIAAIAVGLLIFKAAYELTIESGKDLLDVRLPDEEEELIRTHLAEFTPTVRGVHRLRTRKSGHRRFVEFHIRVDSDMPVLKAHDLSHQIMRSIQEHFPETLVNIHVEPCLGHCLPGCRETCLLRDTMRDSLFPKSNPAGETTDAPAHITAPTQQSQNTQ
jgi:cation diffusion facilitator family transporter